MQNFLFPPYTKILDNINLNGYVGVSIFVKAVSALATGGLVRVFVTIQ
jgi:hypothetical protein